MTFNSVQFILFLPLALLLYYAVNANRRWIVLLLMSYIFYAGWKVEYLALIVYSTLTDYFVAQWIFNTSSKAKRKWLLALSLVSNFGLLILFKYFHFLIGGSPWFKDLADSNETMLWLQFVFEYGIPVGISFYTFQTVSYTLDVYHGRIEPEKNLGKFALFVTFFPQLVAGPIERFSDLHPQLFNAFKPKLETFRLAFQLCLYGFFLKMVIADNLGDIVSPLFADPSAYNQISKVVAPFLFGFQIFADFFGYTLIAIGVAHLFGVRLMDNFKSPYGSYSLREFWSKWHISLSTWFRDYVYIPLGGSKHSRNRWILAILVTFGLSGLWHGANVTYIYWGLFHGAYYVIEQRLFPAPPKDKMKFIEKSLRWISTFIAITFGWLLFRSNSMKDISHFFSGTGETSIFQVTLLPLLIPIIGFFALEILFRQQRIDQFLENKSPLVRWSIYSFALISILLFSARGDMQFIYFQF